jgi:hypothetical protein
VHFLYLNKCTAVIDVSALGLVHHLDLFVFDQLEDVTFGPLTYFEMG